MAKKYSINFKFLSNIYLKIAKKKLKNSDFQISSLKAQLDNENGELTQLRQCFHKLLAENTSIKGDYEVLKKTFENSNKTISIKNNNYDVSIWENVLIKKNRFSYSLQTKRLQEIYTFNDDLNDFMDFFTAKDHSIIVLSVDKKRIVLQFRFK